MNKLFCNCRSATDKSITYVVNEVGKKAPKKLDRKSSLLLTDSKDKLEVENDGEPKIVFCFTQMNS